MTRAAFLSLLLAATVFSMSQAQRQPAAPPKNEDENNPPEEDENLKPKVYPFDPLESERDIKIGDYYMHKRPPSYPGALARYEDATKYNPNSSEAFFRLGEAEEKMKNADAAKIAFRRVLQIAPDSKLGQEAKKKLSQLK